jgi:hypothetical protein
MSLPAPNLDNRTFDQIVKDAIELIPKYCKEWTDFNESDPGITLIHLLAWMTEMTIYRLNLVPNKNYIKFLELMGTSLGPPQSAKTWLVFEVAKPGKETSLKPGTKISTIEVEGEPITFETVDPLYLTASRIIKACSQYQGRYKDHPSLRDDYEPLDDHEAKDVPIFFGKREVPHILYLGDSQLIPVGENISVDLDLKLLVESLLGLTLEWEWWDGEQWNIITLSKDETSGFGKSGKIIFKSLPKMEGKDINRINTFWLRARLENVEGETIPQIGELKRTIMESGLLPDKGYLQTTIKLSNKENEEEVPFRSEINFSGIFYLFGSKPKVNDTFYVGSRAFSKKKATIVITISMAESYSSEVKDAEAKKELSKLKVHWEYSSKSTSAEERRWTTLGTVSPKKVIDRGIHNFKDETKAFTHYKEGKDKEVKGKITFTCPEDIDLRTIDGTESYWIRARILEGSYGAKKEHIPLIKAFSIEYKSEQMSFEHYLTYNYFSYDDLTPLVQKQKPFEPFKIVSKDAPSFYLAFNESLSGNGMKRRIYFRLAEEGTASSSILWEYFSEEVWKELRLIKDTTGNLSQKGAIEFIAPDDWKLSNMFETEGYWMRAKWETGSYSTPPRLNGVHLNAVEARHAVTGQNEILGTSTGEPYQSFTFTNPPILPEPKIMVRELENPSEEEVKRFRDTLKKDFKKELSERAVKSLEERLKEDVDESVDPDTKGITAVWVRWHEVENFFKSTKENRHYTIDPYTGVITFGDGNKGMVPPAGRDNIKARVCYRGGGTKGNVGKDKLTVLETKPPSGSLSINTITNPDPAAGGADVETIEEAKQRGPWLLKHRYRAVTKEDFEKLALQASREVAKALCFMEREGEIKIIIIPKGEQEKLLPKSMLIQKVRAYLDEHRLITAKMIVTGPDYRDISIEAEVVTELQSTEPRSSIRAKIGENLRQFLHPLTGGPKGEGWPMGRAVHISEMYYLLEDVEGVDYVKKVILDNNRRITRIEIGSKEFPYLKKRDITINMD